MFAPCVQMMGHGVISWCYTMFMCLHSCLTLACHSMDLADTRAVRSRLCSTMTLSSLEVERLRYQTR